MIRSDRCFVLVITCWLLFVFTFDGLLIFYFVLCVFNAPAAPAAAGAAIAASVASASSSCYGGGVSRWMVVDGLHVCTYI